MSRKKGRKASKRSVKCTMCSTWRWRGNSDGKERWNINTLKRKQSANEQIKEYYGKRDF